MTALVQNALAILALWLVWQVAEHWLTAPHWAWLVAAAVIGIGAELVIDDERWWLGIGIGGGAAVLSLLTDLILVATDTAKVSVLRRTAQRGM